MGAFERSKGSRGERELAKILAEALGVEVRRNLLQFRESGHDLDGLPVALEVKRCETLNLPEWWRQAVRQGKAAGLPPVLAYRQSRRPWRFVLPLDMINPGLPGGLTVEVDLKAFCHILQHAFFTS